MAGPNLLNPTADAGWITADSGLYTADGGRFAARTFEPASLINRGREIVEIPLSGSPQTFTVDLPGGTYRVRLMYADADEGGWTLDFSDEDGTSLVHGIPLVTGLDLLGQHGHLEIGGRLFIATAGDPARAPGYGDLGQATRLFIEVAE